jgi:hypothetical protein
MQAARQLRATAAEYPNPPAAPASTNALYVDIGYRTFILEAPSSADEMRHTGVELERDAARCSA